VVEETEEAGIEEAELDQMLGKKTNPRLWLIDRNTARF